MGLGGSENRSSDENNKNCNWLHKDTAEITITKHFKNRLDKHLPDNQCIFDPKVSKLPLKVPFSCTHEKSFTQTSSP